MAAPVQDHPASREHLGEEVADQGGLPDPRGPGDEDGGLVAYLVVGDVDGETLSYGGGEIEEWWSADEGVSWQFSRKLVPEPGLLYNNPRPVELADGTEMRDSLVFFGWEGPGGLQRTGSPHVPLRNTGRTYLWHRGEWR